MSDKVRVSQIAELANVSSREVIEKAKKLNFDLKSHLSEVSYEDAQEIINYIISEKISELKHKPVLTRRGLGTIKIPTSKKDNKILIKKLFDSEENKTKKQMQLLNETLAEHNNKKVNTYNSKSNIEELVLDKDENKSKNNVTKELFSSKKIDYKFEYKNILFKGVPGTGKSRTIDKIIEKHLNLKEYPENILRINIHSSSSNSDLMQGIGINSDEGAIQYKEKQGLILNFIQKATFCPLQPFALILEEIQENSLNELIGDLIYLIEDSKRTKIVSADDKEYTYEELIEKFKKDKVEINSVKIPNLVSQNNIYKTMILPNNLFIFCTSNYRDDKKVIEDNLLRRFDVIEIYPKYKKELGDDFINQIISNFLENLNESILNFCSEKGEIHPDRFMIGHSIWLKVDNKQDFERTFLKVITEFKDVKDFHFDDFKEIIKEIEFPFDIEKDYTTYQAWINNLQKNCYDFLEYK
jgi:hypothetical protein